MSELSFLLDLLLNEKLSKSVKDKIAARVKEVEGNMNTIPVMRAQVLPQAKIINGAVQSPSTVAALERQAAGLPPAPETVVASPAAVQAIAQRNQAMNEAVNATHNSGFPKGRTSPRKW